MESDGEIEYLDEDADIVQQYVQPPIQEDEEEQTVLLVERKVKGKKSESRSSRKRKVEEHDSDYDPRESDTPTFKNKKKKPAPAKKGRVYPTLVSGKSVLRTSIIKQPSVISLTNRKKMDIRIPDYDDPLCLPVRAVVKDGNDKRKLQNWNKACLDHLKNCSNMLKPENGETKCSTRSVVLRRIDNKGTGKQEMGIWTKTCVENKDGLKKSQIFQSVLPNFSEPNMLYMWNSSTSKKPKKYHYVDEKDRPSTSAETNEREENQRETVNDGNVEGAHRATTVQESIDPPANFKQIQQALRRRKYPPELIKAGKNMKDAISTLNKVLEKKETKDDDCDMYCKILANKLRKLSEEERLHKMYEIDGLYIKKMQEKSSPNTRYHNGSSSRHYSIPPHSRSHYIISPSPSPTYIRSNSSCSSNSESAPPRPS